MQYESITDNHYFGGDWENDILLLFEDASIDINLILVWKLCITPSLFFPTTWMWPSCSIHVIWFTWWAYSLCLTLCHSSRLGFVYCNVVLQYRCKQGGLSSGGGYLIQYIYGRWTRMPPRKMVEWLYMIHGSHVERGY